MTFGGYDDVIIRGSSELAHLKSHSMLTTPNMVVDNIKLAPHGVVHPTLNILGQEISTC